ncbi:hypothetical protein HMPREF9446_01221 [Bacteroides fluxus YIT 12057]|jgi:hypothetical protein|uniref:Uncharacterized protein n=1 Tax=Bacteroides fluxus YIT 12057 TaxID=763034 RepID=F3PR72_9BACE|nr:hypothetical protein HMPREF9446_01221 [Bacteroides fluxus YIT 12057]
MVFSSNSRKDKERTHRNQNNFYTQTALHAAYIPNGMQCQDKMKAEKTSLTLDSKQESVELQYMF